MIPQGRGSVFERIEGCRVVASPAALDAARWPPGALSWRLAPDEVFVTAVVSAETVNDPHAIVEPDDGFMGVWVDAGRALDFLERSCPWELPDQRPAWAQGSVAGLPVKLWLDHDRVMFVVPAPYAHDLEERLS
jgi:hypothetical protein